MKEALKNIQKAAEKKIADAKISKELEELRVAYLGKKGELTSILKEMRSLSSEERPIIGQVANEVRDSIEKMLKEKGSVIHEKELAEQLKKEKIDVTMPSRFIKKGHLHPLTKTLNEFYDIFTGMGFEVADGPEVELDYYNFEALNLPKDHPARDTQYTF